MLTTNIPAMFLAANKVAGDSLRPIGTTPPDVGIRPGWYSIIWGGPCTITFVFPCSTGSIAFESQGGMEIFIDQCTITSNVDMILQEVPDNRILKIESGMFSGPGGRIDVGNSDSRVSGIPAVFKLGG